jgi:hypothetical protein
LKKKDKSNIPNYLKWQRNKQKLINKIAQIIDNLLTPKSLLSCLLFLNPYILGLRAKFPRKFIMGVYP